MYFPYSSQEYPFPASAPIGRIFFKLNMEAVKLCISEPFDFQVPFVTLTLAIIGGMASFEFHPGCCTALICFGCFYVTEILLGKY